MCLLYGQVLSTTSSGGIPRNESLAGFQGHSLERVTAGNGGHPLQLVLRPTSAARILLLLNDPVMDW